MDNSLIVDGLNVGDLDDEELAQRLQSLGFNPGPILSTTRSVYQRKLARMLRHEPDILEKGDSSDDEGEDAEIRPSPPLHSTFLDSPRSTLGSPPNFCASPPTTMNYDDLRRRPISSDPDVSWRPEDIVSQVEPPPGEMEKPLVSSKVKIILVGIALLFALFVYFNMEDTPSNPFNAQH